MTSVSRSGRVVDAVSGKGIPDALVLMSLSGFNSGPIGGHGVSYCIDGMVVRTNASGEFRFDWRWEDTANPAPPAAGARIVAYVPSMRQVSPVYSYAGAKEEARHHEMVLSMEIDGAPADQRFNRLITQSAKACTMGRNGRSFLAYFKAVHEEFWKSVCAPDLEGDSLDWQDFQMLEALALRATRHSHELRHPQWTETRHWDEFDKLQVRARRNLPAYLPSSTSLRVPSQERDLYPLERAIACRDYSPELISREFPE